MSIKTIAAVALLVMPLAVLRQAANADEEGIYGAVPGYQRGRLIQSMDDLVSDEIRRDWRALYQMIDHQPGESEEVFAKRMQSGRALRQFLPSKVSFYPPNDSWIIEGCASFEGDEKNEGRLASVHARWAHARWYLSPITIELLGEEDKMSPRTCKMHQ
ncbi:MAG TPA: hypothetical protein VEH50_12680 [Methylomirabilota bacterium]|nr:hypothetical protein [Methylomirabilota bacterium]